MTKNINEVIDEICQLSNDLGIANTDPERVLDSIKLYSAIEDIHDIEIAANQMLHFLTVLSNQIGDHMKMHGITDRTAAIHDVARRSNDAFRARMH